MQKRNDQRIMSATPISKVSSTFGRFTMFWFSSRVTYDGRAFAHFDGDANEIMLSLEIWYFYSPENEHINSEQAFEGPTAHTGA